MAIEIILRAHFGSLIPVDQIGADQINELRWGSTYKATLTQPRNINFHRKAFALLKVIYDAWDVPDRQHKGQPVKKNMDSLREDLTILAGYYETEFKFDGTLRLKAKSWAFAAMSQEEFEQLYSAIIDVALSKILTTYTKDDIDSQVDKLLSFA
jgi:hypothetical protein